MASDWTKISGKYVDVYAQDGSYAARCAPSELRSADRSVDALAHILSAPEHFQWRFEVYLSDPIPRTEDPAAAPGAETLPGAKDTGSIAGAREEGGGRIVRVVSPEAPGEPIALSLVPRAVASWCGGNALQSGLIEGLAGYIASQIHENATISSCNQWVRTEMDARRPVGVLPRPPRPAGMPLLPEAPEHPGGPYYHPAATSFVAYLIHNNGNALDTFLKSFDPASRDRAAIAAYQQPLAKLEESWIGEMKRTGANFKKVAAFLRQLMPLLKPYRWKQIEALGYMLLSAVATLGPAYLTQVLINDLQVLAGKLPAPIHGNLILRLIEAVAPSLWKFAGLYLLISAVNVALTARTTYVTSWVGQRLLIDLQESLFAKLQDLSHNFYSKNRVGDLMSRLYSDLTAVQRAITQILGRGMSQFIILIITLGVMCGYAFCLRAYALIAIFIVTIPIFWYVASHFKDKYQTVGREQQQRVADVSSTIEENLTAHSLVKALGLEKSQIDRFHERLSQQFRAGMKMVGLNAQSSAGTAIVVALGQLAVLFTGGVLVSHNPDAALPNGHGMTLGALMMLNMLLPNMLSQLSGLADTGQAAQQAIGALDRVDEVFNAKVAVADSDGAAPLAPLDRHIQLESVDFSYGGDRPILRGMSIEIAAGSHIAIVGASGSGKSTIVNLLMRFWDPDNGCVKFDDRNLVDVSLSSLRGQIGLVFQDTFVFDTTLRDNIAIARPNATDVEIHEAARQARLDDLIAADPEGIDRLLGERGSKMSGGQRQRLAIARALLRNPRILILDEATSALDPITEAGLVETLAEVSKGRTTITITHRLAMAAASDRIFVLDAGRVVEEGRPDELLAKGGLYRRLWDEQMGAGVAIEAKAAPQQAGMGSREALVAARLKRAPLFAQVDDAAIASLARSVAQIRFAPGDRIVNQGDAGDRMYVIGQGEVEVLVKDGTGEERAIAALRDGDFFGEMALISDEPRTATIRASGPVLVYELMAVSLQALLAAQPSVRESIEATVGSRKAANTKLPN